MARPKKSEPENKQVIQPDYERAASVFANDVAPARTRQKRAMKDAKEAWDEIKNECHVPKAGFAKGMDVAAMEFAEQQTWLRGFKNALRIKGVFLEADLMDIAEGVNGDSVSIVAMGTHDIPKPVSVQ